MVTVSILFFFYFILLFVFSIISNPVYYCGLLVLNSIVCSLIRYLIFGFSWYSLLFCLVYIGGVYILFVFVSVYSPKRNYVTYINFNYYSIFALIFILLIIGSVLFYGVLKLEFSKFLCSLMEGKFYVTMCLTLIFGFLVSSLIMSVKFNYYR